MTDVDTPAEDTTPAGEPSGRPGEQVLAALPAKVRVHALARLLGTSSRDLLAVLARLGAGARSAQSSLDRDTVAQVVDDLYPAETPPATEIIPPAEDGAPAIEDLAPAGTSVPDPDAAPAAGSGPAVPAPMFLAPEAGATPSRGRRRRGSRTEGFVTPAETTGTSEDVGEAGTAGSEAAATPGKDGELGRRQDTADSADTGPDESSRDDPGDDDGSSRRRRRGRRGRGRGRGSAEDGAEGTDGSEGEDESGTDTEDSADTTGDGGGAGDYQGAKRAKEGKGAKGVKGGQGAKDDAGDSAADDADGSDDADLSDDADGSDDGDDGDDDQASSSGSRRRRRRRRRSSEGSSDGSSGSSDGSSGGEGAEDPANTVTHVRDRTERSGSDEVKGVKGSTRLEAKRQRRRDGRDAGRRRPQILSESEFLARREAVERAMVVRQQAGRSQIGVLEDGVLVEHFVAGEGQNSMVGNVYLGRVQNVLPSMEAAFVDIGRGRNAVLYAGEVNWDASGLEGKQRKIEQALSSGDQVLVQVTKDPVGHKGSRLTTQISLPGRFLVFVPAGGATGISRKLPDNERKRLKEILKRIVPDESGVIIRTAAEGVPEDDLERDVRRLTVQWEVIERKATEAKNAKGTAPRLVYEEPDLLIRVVRDMFNEDFSSLVISGDRAHDTLEGYLSHVAPELSARVSRHTGSTDVFAAHRIDEQLAKALDRKVWLPSGGTLVIDRTEAMTVIDVNTGKFTGSGGNLEETVTRNNLEAAEEVVRQLRLRDIGGMIVIDFIDMVLESNRDLVLRRLTECLGRDRTRHQVSEVTSLGLVQMTRKRVGQGLLDEFSTTCEHCRGRGVLVTSEPVVGVENGSGADGKGSSGDAGRGQGSASSDGGTGDQGGRGGGSGSGNGSGSGSGRRRGRGRRSAQADAGPPGDATTGTDTVAAVVPPAEADADITGDRARGTPTDVTTAATGSKAASEDTVAEATVAEVALETDLAERPDVSPNGTGPSGAEPVAPTLAPSSGAVSADAASSGAVSAEAPSSGAVSAAAASSGTSASDTSDPAPAAPATSRPRRRRGASRPAGPPQDGPNTAGGSEPAGVAGVGVGGS